jgi:hypothetical protein
VASSSRWRGGCGLAGRPARRWVGGDASQLYAPGLQLNEEQHVQPLQEHGVHGQGSRRPGCPLPAGVGTTAKSGMRRPDAALAGGRWRAGPGDGACGDPAAKPQQLPADALVAPPRVLAGQPHDRVCTCWGTGGRPRGNVG